MTLFTEGLFKLDFFRGVEKSYFDVKWFRNCSQQCILEDMADSLWLQIEKPAFRNTGKTQEGATELNRQFHCELGTKQIIIR